MSDIIVNSNGNVVVLKRFEEVAGSIAFAFNFGAVGSLSADFSTDAASADTFSADMDAIFLKTNVANAHSLAGVSFNRGSKDYVVKANGDVHTDLNPTTGNGTKVGEMTMGNGNLFLDEWAAGSSPVVNNWRGVAAAPVNGPFSPFGGYEVMFRTAKAPIRTGSLNVLGTLMDGTTFNVTSDDDGFINSSRVKGVVNFNTGVVDLIAVTPTAPDGGLALVDISFLGIPGVTEVYLDQFKIETLRYNAVAFSYIPLDAELLGIDPVRLPSDGRVPIFRKGGLAVVGYTHAMAPDTLANAEVVDTGQVRLSRLEVWDNDGERILSGYTVNLEAGTMTVVSIAGWAQPVTVKWRIEDMVQIMDAQISGLISFVPQLTHDYPLGSYISSALPAGDLVSRVSLMFDQATGSTFSDVQEGSPATGTYNDTAFPLVLTNAGTENQRWMAKFLTTTTVQIIGEKLGVVINSITINGDIAPENPVTGEPYFVIPEGGWGAGGWSVGNLLRFNTVGARFTYWAVRTIQQGPETGEDYQFSLLTRANVDNPL